MGILARISARAPIYITDARANPGWALMFVLARLVPVRQALWKLSSTSNSDSLEKENSLFASIEIDPLLTELSRSGLVRGQISLPARLCGEVLQFAEETPCFGNLQRRIEFLPADHDTAEFRHSQSILTGHYFDRCDNCPAIHAIRQDKTLHRIAEAYLGRRARIVSTRLWWSFPTTRTVNKADLNLASQNQLHFDLDDWRALKFFFYLTDVTADSGPFAYVKGSHRFRLPRHQWTLLCGHPNNEVLSAYGAQNLEAVEGAAGTGMIVDPFGFHMGIRPKAIRRLMLEIGYGVTNVLARRFYGESYPSVRDRLGWSRVVP
jgi:hypothetical protein